MELLQRIRADWIAARKARESTKAAVLGTLIGAIETRSKTFSPARDLTEAEVVAEVKKMLDGVLETGRLLKAGDPRAATNRTEQAALEVYMPAQMTEAEIRAFADERKAQGANLGQIMAALKAERPGMYDGRTASQVVKAALAG